MKRRALVTFSRKKAMKKAGNFKAHSIIDHRDINELCFLAITPKRDCVIVVNCPDTILADSNIKDLISCHQINTPPLNVMVKNDIQWIFVIDASRRFKAL